VTGLPRDVGAPDDAPRVRVVRGAAVGRIVLSRPAKRNALDRRSAEELVEALKILGDDEAVRVVLLSAEGDDFCAGADLEALERMLGFDAEAHRQDAAALGRVYGYLRAMNKPVVAAVQGRALAGGAGLATACDIVLAHEQATFGYPEVRIGFVPAMVMTMLRRIAGERQAADLVLTGRTVDAYEALRIGLVSRVLAADRFEEEVESIVADMAKSPPAAMALTKRLFYAMDLQPFRGAIERGVDGNVEARLTDEFREGVRRFTRRAKEGG
jgi:methylglutaconyl-CoA hydratase